MRHNIRLVAIDLDGTTLRRDKTIGRETIRAVNAAIAGGTEVIIATGRSRAQSERYVHDFSGMRYVLTSSGAAVYDLTRNWEKVISNEISSEIMLEILAVADSVDCFPIMSAGGKTLYTAHMAPLAVEYGLGAYTYELNTFGTGVPKLSDWYGENLLPVESISLYFRERDKRQEVVERLKHLPLYFALPDEPAVEISKDTANKGDALRVLCAMLEIPMDQVMAIGDSDNDVPMLEAVGLAVASGNAPDDVKAHAGYVTADCDHDGVAAAVEKFILNRTYGESLNGNES